jgi:hypothetical protein
MNEILHRNNGTLAAFSDGLRISGADLLNNYNTLVYALKTYPG